MKAKGELDGLTANTEYVLRITEYGDIQGGMCADIGDEFNPLATEPQVTWILDEFGYWIESYARPTNEDGRIDAFASDANGNIQFRQDVLL